MKNSTDIRSDRYEVRIQGILDPVWSEWLGCLYVTHTTTETILSFDIQDQTALHGLLMKLRDMNLKILSVIRIGPEPMVDKDQNNQDR